MDLVSLYRASGYRANRYLGVLFILRHTYLSMEQCLTNSRSLDLLCRAPKRRRPILTSLTSSSGTAWTMALDASRSSLLGQWTSRYAHTQISLSLKGEPSLSGHHPDPDTTDYNVSEVPDEHKSHNCIELENGQFCLYPNRTRIYDLSITPENPKTPDFKVSTHYFQVENGVRWGRLGDTDEYFWETESEKARINSKI